MWQIRKDSVDAGPKTSPGIFLQALIRSGAFYSFKWCYTLCLHNGCSIAPENKKTRSKSQESQSHKSDKSKTETKKHHKEVGLYMHIWHDFTSMSHKFNFDFTNGKLGIKLWSCQSNQRPWEWFKAGWQDLFSHAVAHAKMQRLPPKQNDNIYFYKQGYRPKQTSVYVSISINK